MDPDQAGLLALGHRLAVRADDEPTPVAGQAGRFDERPIVRDPATPLVDAGPVMGAAALRFE
jgi:hypothetical protein